MCVVLQPSAPGVHTFDRFRTEPAQAQGETSGSPSVARRCRVGREPVQRSVTRGVDVARVNTYLNFQGQTKDAFMI